MFEDVGQQAAANIMNQQLARVSTATTRQSGMKSRGSQRGETVCKFIIILRTQLLPKVGGANMWLQVRSLHGRNETPGYYLKYPDKTLKVL